MSLQFIFVVDIAARAQLIDHSLVVSKPAQIEDIPPGIGLALRNLLSESPDFFSLETEDVNFALDKLFEMRLKPLEPPKQEIYEILPALYTSAKNSAKRFAFCQSDEEQEL